MRLILFFLLFLNILNANSKIALLIGNQDYDKASLQLKNPINDIESIEETLEKIGFEVELLKDASKREMEDELDDFYKRADGAEIALIYFSGHGLQVFDVETDRVINYLLPIEANVKRLRDLKDLIRLDRVVIDSSSAQKSIVLIDACRDNPLYDEIAKIFRKYGTKSTSVSKGLGQIDFKTNDVLIAFATTSNNTANDGRGDLSPYAKALSDNLQKSADISLVLRDVRDDVLVSTDNEQEPVIIKNTLSGKVCLSGDCGEVEVVERVIEKDVNEWLIWVIVATSIIGLILIVFVRRKVEVLEERKILTLEKSSIEDVVILNGLMYQNHKITKICNWNDAQEYARALRLGGFEDWRLPTRNELNQISNIKMYGKFDDNWKIWIKRNFEKSVKEDKQKRGLFILEPFLGKIPHGRGSCFWTSEEKNKSYAWNVCFSSGTDSPSAKISNHFVLCVR